MSVPRSWMVRKSTWPVGTPNVWFRFLARCIGGCPSRRLLLKLASEAPEYARVSNQWPADWDWQIQASVLLDEDSNDELWWMKVSKFSSINHDFFCSLMSLICGACILWKVLRFWEQTYTSETRCEYWSTVAMSSMFLFWRMWWSDLDLETKTWRNPQLLFDVLGLSWAMVTCIQPIAASPEAPGRLARDHLPRSHDSPRPRG